MNSQQILDILFGRITVEGWNALVTDHNKRSVCNEEVITPEESAKALMFLLEQIRERNNGNACIYRFR